jgi:hypothetical protein
METGLRLLMRDGALELRFRPRLNPQQYAELAQLIERPSTKLELCAALEEWGKKQGLEVMCDDAI